MHRIIKVQLPMPDDFFANLPRTSPRGFDLYLYKPNCIMPTEETNELTAKNNAQVEKLQKIVQDAVREQELITDNLAHPPADVLSRGQRISDKVARFGGSWNFIILFGVVLFVWIAFNALAPQKETFDPYPFILMNLVLSCIAALQAPVIMMSQNRQEEKDRIRSENDYLINLKAELEVRSLHQKMDLLLMEEIKTLYDVQVRQIAMLGELQEKMDNLSRK